MKKIKKFIACVSFKIGVNIIGLPIFHDHIFNKPFAINKSAFHS
jgi:hypothetical protein